MSLILKGTYQLPTYIFALADLIFAQIQRRNLKNGPPSPDYNKQAPKGHGSSPSKLSSSGPKSLRPKPNQVQRPN